uniref:OmpA-like domain-containing protein n=1 Tax=candidate division WOR-3 bacterium TaxID=2052148 RepID=A0A7C4XEC6_UNCW3
MRKLLITLSFLPVLFFGQEISVYGNRGMFKIQYAQPHNMGMLSFHLSPAERFEELQSLQAGTYTTDRKHFFNLSGGLSYSIIDYLEARFRMTGFLKWFEMNNYPIKRGDPDPPWGFETIEIGAKAGYGITVDQTTPLTYAFGIEGHINWGPGLSTDKLEFDKRFYSDSFSDANATPVAPHFPPYVPHDPDYATSGLVDFRVGPFAAHLNGGWMVTGPDHRPEYVPPDSFYQRPNYILHGIGIELIPTEEVRFLCELYGYYDFDAKEESLWITPGVRFGARSVSFDLGCELALLNPQRMHNLSPERYPGTWWKVFFNLSGGADLIKKVEVHIPIAKVSGRVYDAKTGEPITATISFPGSDKEPIQTSENGTYQVSFGPGSFRIHVEAEGYRWKEQGVVLKDGDQIILDFNLNKKEIAKVIGKIYDAETKLPIVANITFPQTQLPATNSDTSGMYSVILSPGTYRLHIEATGYQFDEKVITLQEGDTKVVDIGLAKISVEQATLMGKVSDVESGAPLLAQITFVDSKIPAKTTDQATGIYKVTVPPGTYVVKVEAMDYIPETAPVVLNKDETKIQNFTLRKVPKVGERIILRGIYFDFNSAVIKPESYPVLDDAAKVLIAKPKMRVEIGGHTDSIGSDSYNMKLSYQRANAVKDYLVRYHNIDASRLEVRGYGESQPIADNRTKSGRDQNRRIEFKILSVE